ncbi:MAG: transporter substrate-binding domain-containing protein [Rhodospirillaceae bacterium]|nr:transporter substrate-binding domain-containing protein [Rhodospirillaceae bacterium]
MIKKLVTGGAAAAAIFGATALPAPADTLDDIVARGKVVVGVKADFPPWGMRDAAGRLVGMEHDMAADFARRLSAAAGKPIAVEKVVVVASNRMQFLVQGKTDMFIATMSNKPERRKIVGIVQPGYYSSGVAVLAHRRSGIDGWASLKGRKICGIQGAWYNRDHGLRNGAEVIAFKWVAEVEKALLDGRCAGWLYSDSAFVARKVNSPKTWAGFDIATPIVDNVPWGAAVRKEDLDSRLGRMLSAAIVDWHKSGFLIALERKWGIPATRWLADMRRKCLAGDTVCDGKYDPGE